MQALAKETIRKPLSNLNIYKYTFGLNVVKFKFMFVNE